MRTILWRLLLGVLTLYAAPDTNVTGKWSGKFNLTDQEGQSKETTALLVLTQSGSGVTGTVGPDEGEQHTITKGNIDGEKLTLIVEEDGRTIQFNLVATADRITGDVNLSNGGETRKAKIDVTRAK